MSDNQMSSALNTVSPLMKDLETSPDAQSDRPIPYAEGPPLHATVNGLLVASQTKLRFPNDPQTELSFGPFIRVKSPEPWSLPLLRLTPLPTPSSAAPWRSNNLYNLENVPFVSVSDSPFRLPGPSRLAGLFSANLDQ